MALAPPIEGRQPDARGHQRQHVSDLRIAVQEPLLSLRDGILRALDAMGVEAVTHAAADPSKDHHVLIGSFGTNPTDALVRITAEGRPVVALLDTFTEQRAEAVVRLGAAAALDRGDFPEVIASAAVVVWARYRVVPGRMLHDPARAAAELPDLDVREVQWLAALASGASARSIAVDADYSERQMHRKLRTIYRKLGVRTRTEALLRCASLLADEAR